MANPKPGTGEYAQSITSRHLRVKEAHVFNLDVQELNEAGTDILEEWTNLRQDATADQSSTLVTDDPIVSEVQGQVKVKVCEGQNCKRK